MSLIDLKLATIALDHAKGSDFENFFHAFYPALAGINFVPLGGTHDRGADAFQDDRVFETESGRVGTFYQATIQEDHRAKVRQTIKRLREVGREPKTLQYFTSQTVPVIEQEEEMLSAELDVDIKIRDRKFIIGRINHSDETKAAYASFLAPNLSFLTELGGATTIEASPNFAARTMCVFLGQEIDRRRGKSELLEAVTDSLILWALEDTDPAKGIFLNRAEILARIEKALPSAKHFVRGSIDHRLNVMTDKGNATGREIRWYKKEDKFCLPFETRAMVEKENTEDEYMKLSVLDLYAERAAEFLSNEDTLAPEKVAKIAHRALELTFEKEGLELATFLTGEKDENSYPAISDQVDSAIDEAGLNGASAVLAKEVALGVLRKAFYSSEEYERLYYGKLSRTFSLMLTLRNEPKVVEYFKGMSGNFVLLIGSDIIIRALSERYLPEADQMTVNMLRILRASGSKLLLTRMVADEVQSHLKGTDYEFINWFAELEPYMTPELVRHCKKILVRAYFYARFDRSNNARPAGWKSFLGQFCDYADLHRTEKARDQIKGYLIEKFGFDYLDDEDLSLLTDDSEVAALAAKFKSIKSEEVLALNDARQILAVYGKRREMREGHKPNPYGYRSWWLTHETKVRHATADLIHQKGSQYIIRPEFILNFISLSPKMEEVRASYNAIFPTLLGVRLANRMREDIFHDVMGRAKEMKSVDDARAKVMMAEMSNRLKGDNFKRYEIELSSGLLG
ncbi:hypothetical protein [Rhizobium ruizarguesonis]|uniref:hypothetical protein n=1 Tax=Rhizobium TaxID=379 RepID=UPI00102F6423|nr:hypothetical protein [Rhizobium ruizarguesonis]TBA44396.1 hypothetical protein ELH62_19370 [Rhizobium ruizarguesonis]TBD65481.1 hypothetical protein ELH22_20205 [Rhizobium ruizarguesonis]